jgi:hypothetical protein
LGASEHSTCTLTILVLGPGDANEDLPVSNLVERIRPFWQIDYDRILLVALLSSRRILTRPDRPFHCGRASSPRALCMSAVYPTSSLSKSSTLSAVPGVAGSSTLKFGIIEDNVVRCARPGWQSRHGEGAREN